MTNKPENPPNGPAFPHETEEKYYPGMTLRDYFAAAALQGMITYAGWESSVDNRSKRAYLYADSMLKERAK